MEVLGILFRGSLNLNQTKFNKKNEYIEKKSFTIFFYFKIITR